jgi:hypothetical protein
VLLLFALLVAAKASQAAVEERRITPWLNPKLAGVWSFASSEGQFVRKPDRKDFRGHLGQSLPVHVRLQLKIEDGVGSAAFEEPDALIA